MTCSEFMKKIHSFIDDELSDAQKKQMLMHMNDCDSCAAQYQSMRAMVSALNALPDMQPTANFNERLSTALQATTGDKAMKKKWNWGALSAIAAAVLVVGIGGATLLSRGNISYDKSIAEDMNYNTTEMDDNYSRSQNYDEDGESMPAEMPQPEADMDMRNESKNFDATDNELGLTETTEDTSNQSNVLPGQQQKKIIYTASMNLQTKSFDQDIVVLENAAKDLGGYVQYKTIEGLSYELSGGDGRYASISLRIPAQNYTSFISQSSQLGKLQYLNESTDDITMDYYDVEIRLNTLKKQLERLEVILDNSDKLDDVLALERELARVTTDIERLEGNLRYWDDNIDYSTVNVSLREIRDEREITSANPSLGERMSTAFFRSINNIKRGSENFAVWLVGAIPTLAILLLIALILFVIIITRVRRAKRKTQKHEED